MITKQKSHIADIWKSLKLKNRRQWIRLVYQWFQKNQLYSIVLMCIESLYTMRKSTFHCFQ